MEDGLADIRGPARAPRIDSSGSKPNALYAKAFGGSIATETHRLGELVNTAGIRAHGRDPEKEITMPFVPVIPAGSGKPLAPYSPGTLANGVLYVSGTLPFDANNDVLHVGDAAAQTRLVLNNIQRVVEAAGGTLADVTFNQIFLTDWANYAAAQRRLRRVLPGQQTGSLLHPVRAREAGRAGRNREHRAYRAMNYEITGRPGAAEAIVLSAGLGGLASFWMPQLAALEERLRVVQYDHRGTGRNSAALPENYGIADMADDVLGILDDAGLERAHFLGHALGGLIGLDIARRRPERLGRMILVNAWAKADPHTERCFDIRIGILRAQGAAAYVAAQPLFLHTATYLSANHDAILAEVTRGTASFQGADNLLRRIDALRRFDARADLAAIGTPTLVAAARDDLLVPWTASQALAVALPAGQFFLAVEGGHAFSVEHPEPLNDAILHFLLTG